MDDKQIRDVIGAIYEAASAPERWGGIVRNIRLATHSRFGMLWFGNPNCSVEEFAANQGDFLAFEHADLSLSDFEDFVLRSQDPSLTEPYAEIAHRVPLGRAVVGHELVPIDEFRKTEFYHQVAGPAGNVHLLGAIMARRNGRIDAITFYRPDQARNYGREEQRLMDVFIPHIRRSLNLYNKLQKADVQTALLQTSIDTLTGALILLNENGKVVFLNAAAERLLRRNSLPLRKTGQALRRASCRHRPAGKADQRSDRHERSASHRWCCSDPSGRWRATVASGGGAAAAGQQRRACE